MQTVGSTSMPWEKFFDNVLGRVMHVIGEEGERVGYLLVNDLRIIVVEREGRIYEYEIEPEDDELQAIGEGISAVSDSAAERKVKRASVWPTH